MLRQRLKIDCTVSQQKISLIFQSFRRCIQPSKKVFVNQEDKEEDITLSFVKMIREEIVKHSPIKMLSGRQSFL